jgi:hypothetical protein
VIAAPLASRRPHVTAECRASRSEPRWRPERCASQGLSHGILALAPLALLTFAPGCIHVDANVDADEDISFGFADFGTTCSGAGMTQTDSGLTTWTKTPVEDRCQVDFNWGGTLIDMAAVRAKADEKAQGATLTIQSIDLELDAVALRDQSGADITPPRVPAWEAHFGVGGQAVADFNGTDLASLLAMPLSFEAPPSVLQAAQQAFDAAAPLDGTATARLVVEMSDVAALAAAAGPHVQFHFRAHVDANAKKNLL